MTFTFTYIMSYFFILFFIAVIKEYIYNHFSLKIEAFTAYFLFLLNFLFLLTFFIYFRIFSFFIYRKPLNILEFFHKINLFLIIIFIIVLFLFFIKIYKITIFLLKYSFLKQHFFFLNSEKYVYYDKYIKIILLISTWNYKITLFFFRKKINITYFYKHIYIFMRFFFDFLLFILILFDIIYNNKVLMCTTVFLPYYGLYKFIFNLNYFFIFNLDLRFDIEISYLIYSNSEFEELNNSFIFLPKNYNIEDKHNFIRIYVHRILLNSYIL